MSELERLKKENQQLKNALLITEHKLKNAAEEIKQLNKKVTRYELVYTKKN